MTNSLRRSQKSLRNPEDAKPFVRSIEPVIVRDLNGKILSWNRAAERSYGWSKAHAVGNVSHHLLETIFPVALEDINSQLLNSGLWQGELIHSLSDGSRVRVNSRWELVEDQHKQSTEVVEINNYFEQLRPESSHFTKPVLSQRMIAFFRDKRVWLAVLLAMIGVVELVIELTNESASIPIF